MAGSSKALYYTPEFFLCRSKLQDNRLLQERYSASYANTNPNFVFQNIPQGTVSDEVLLSILQVIDNILCRGTITPPSVFLCSNYLKDVLNSNTSDHCIDLKKWNEWKKTVGDKKINTYSRDIPLWQKTIKGGRGINGEAAYHFYHDLLPEWFERTPVIQLMRPEVRFDEIMQEAAESNYLESAVDFYLEQARLVIEIDGEQHQKQQKEDSDRDRFLRKSGCTVIRIPTSAFSDEEALTKHRNQIQCAVNKSGLIEKYSGYTRLAKQRDAYQKRKDLDIILRFELLIISLIKHCVLPINAQNWNLTLLDSSLQPLCQAAYEDVQNWFENIAAMCCYQTKLPELVFCESSDADAVINFEYNKCWTDEALDNPDQIFVRNDHFENCCYYELQNAATLPYSMLHIEENCEENLLFFLRNIFGYTGFNEGQRKIICRALSGKDTIGILPTGSGKSLCYQMAGLLQPGITMTICPLVALIKDQKKNLDWFGIDHTSFISGEISAKTKESALRKLRNKQINFIWIAPERFQIEKFRNELCDIGRNRVIKYAVLDEVHCLSEWGHDFRTSYLVLVDTIHEYCGKECILYGLTATASDFVLKDILRTFGLANSSVVSSETMHRPELKFHIVTPFQNQREDVLVGILKELQEKYRETGNIFEPHEDESICGIIFTVNSTGKNFGAKELANRLDLKLSESKKYVRYFSSKIDPKEAGATKEQIQDMYMNNEVPLLVATKAFGMGINKPNVRYTIHQSLPWSSEAFYQEAGRAGRSGDPAKKESDCYIIYCRENVESSILEKLFDKNTSVEEVKSISTRFSADLSPILYLWGKNNVGISVEMDRMQKMLEVLREGSSQIPFGTYIDKSQAAEVMENENPKPCHRPKIEVEKTLYHLSLLGFVRDWTIDYSASLITVNCSEDISMPVETRIRQNLYTYIRRYDPFFTLDGNQREYAVYRQINADETRDFVDRYIEVLLKWTEVNIVYYRKRSIANMISDIENSDGDGDRLKELIEKRFVIVHEESPLAKIQSRDMDVKTWFAAIIEEDADTTIAVLQRHLETYQNNPAANYVLSMLQLITNRESVYGLESYLLSSLTALDEPNDRREVADFSIQIAKESKISEKNLDILGACLAKAYPEHARHVQRELRDRGSLCEILSEQISAVRKLGGIL